MERKPAIHAMNPYGMLWKVSARLHAASAPRSVRTRSAKNFASSLKVTATTLTWVNLCEKCAARHAEAVIRLQGRKRRILWSLTNNYEQRLQRHVKQHPSRMLVETTIPNTSFRLLHSRFWDVTQRCITCSCMTFHENLGPLLVNIVEEAKRRKKI